MIELISEQKIRSPEYMRIRCEFYDLWQKLFLNTARIDRASFYQFGPLWLLLAGALRNRYLHYAWTRARPTQLPSHTILRSNQLWASRLWEYPWAILNSNLQRDSRVLDTGSGHSLFPLYLAKTSSHVDSIDTQQTTMQRVAPTLARICAVTVNYQVGDVLDIPAPDSTYDCVFSLSVLEHLEEERRNGIPVNLHRKKLDRRAIKECLRVVKPHGRVVLTLDYAPPDISQRSFHLDYVRELIDEFRSNLLEASSQFSQIEFTDEKREELRQLWIDFFPYALEYPSVGALGIILTKQ